MAPCGGCAAKVDPDTLARMLAALGDETSRADVVVGLAERDDAAVLRHPADRHLVVTVDAFPPFLDDLHTVGWVAAVNALSDVYATGGTPRTALALVSVSGDGSERGAAVDLAQLLGGARAALTHLDVALVGGHTLAGAETWIGFSVVGDVAPGGAWTKSGARAGDVLILTKPLGTGVILAATRAGECPASWTEAALASMKDANDRAARILERYGPHACTDVSGFGLASHLGEMASASGLGVRLWLDDVPALPGALELLAAGWRSSAAGALEAQAAALVSGRLAAGDDRFALLCDPQTSGGLLAAVAAHQAVEIDAALRDAGIASVRVGEMIEGTGARLGARASIGSGSSDSGEFAPGRDGR